MSRSERLSTGKNSDLQGIEYETYTLSRREWVLYGAEGILLAAVLDYVFYRSFLLILLIFPAGILFPLALKKKLKQRRMEKLRGEFKDAILAVASGLNAGYSVENAFAVSLKDMIGQPLLRIGIFREKSILIRVFSMAYLKIQAGVMTIKMDIKNRTGANL